MIGIRLVPRSQSYLDDRHQIVEVGELGRYHVFRLRIVSKRRKRSIPKEVGPIRTHGRPILFCANPFPSLAFTFPTSSCASLFPVRHSVHSMDADRSENWTIAASSAPFQEQQH